jgi:hypothetical protein
MLRHSGRRDDVSTVRRDNIEGGTVSVTVQVNHSKETKR